MKFVEIEIGILGNLIFEFRINFTPLCFVEWLMDQVSSANTPWVEINSDAAYLFHTLTISRFFFILWYILSLRWKKYLDKKHKIKNIIHTLEMILTHCAELVETGPHLPSAPWPGLLQLILMAVSQTSRVLSFVFDI